MNYKDWKAVCIDKTKTWTEWKKEVQEKENSGKIEKSRAFVALNDVLKESGVKHIPVKHSAEEKTSEEIINTLAGGDMTDGSCSSLAFAYIGNKHGLSVLDFRGGNSQRTFARMSNITLMSELPGVHALLTRVGKEAVGTAKILKNIPQNKEYYLAAGEHAAILRNNAGKFEYLELQSAKENGWKPLTGKTLYERFGCRKTVGGKVALMEVDSFKGNAEFEEILGYINTNQDQQQKGAKGNVK